MTSASVPGVCILDSIFGSCGNIWKVGRLPPSNPGLLLFGDDQDEMKSFDRNLVKTATAVEHRTWVGNRAVWRNTDNHAVICSAALHWIRCHSFLRSLPRCSSLILIRLLLQLIVSVFLLSVSRSCWSFCSFLLTRVDQVSRLPGRILLGPQFTQAHTTDPAVTNNEGLTLRISIYLDKINPSIQIRSLRSPFSNGHLARDPTNVHRLAN